MSLYNPFHSTVKSLRGSACLIFKTDHGFLVWFETLKCLVCIINTQNTTDILCNSLLFPIIDEPADGFPLNSNGIKSSIGKRHGPFLLGEGEGEML